jgi:hypothetical protein
MKEMGVDLKGGGEWTTTKCRTMVSVKGKNNSRAGGHGTSDAEWDNCVSSKKRRRVDDTCE